MNLIKYLWYLFLVLTLVTGSSCASKKILNTGKLQIAVIADVHLQDVYGTFGDSDFRGLRNPINGKNTLIRSMGSQLRSTRIFNENYFAFLAALDDVVKRNVKFVILPGDFSDDGQPVHIRGLKQILDRYSNLYGISFFLITGNHDVVQPYDRMDGKVDFLGVGGKLQPIMSQQDLFLYDSARAHPVVISSDIRNLGYLGITDLLEDYGFYPKKEYIYWESPYTGYSYDSYSFQQAKKMAFLENRTFLLPGNEVALPDVSYLVEPTPGLWLLALDANTYLAEESKSDGGGTTGQYPNNGLGLNNLLEHKKYLLEWVQKVVLEAEKHGKMLLAFSHYPMVDFNNEASKHIDNLLEGSKMQLRRVPDKNVASMFADVGLKIHLGGHMHMNDTGIGTSEKGNTLVNIQVPSLAAYPSAYKLVTIKKQGTIEVETIAVDSVPRFDEFFKLYEQEYNYLKNTDDETIWDHNILSSKNYHEFITWHLRELVRLRFLKAEWPSDFVDFLLSVSGEDLLVLSQIDNGLSFEAILKSINSDTKRSSEIWKKAFKMAKDVGVEPKQFSKWTGLDFLFDLYRLRSADELALKEIGTDRLNQYIFIMSAFLKQGYSFPDNNPLKANIIELMSILKKFLNGVPSDHFEVNLNTGEVHSLKIKNN